MPCSKRFPGVTAWLLIGLMTGPSNISASEGEDTLSGRQDLSDDNPSDSRENEAKFQSTPRERIVVKGQRIEQSLSEAPLSATVLTRQIVEDARIRELRDIDNYVPNVQFSRVGQVGPTFVTIRGIESNPFIVNRSAVYIDGIPYREPRAQQLANIERVEVLRGPQGTLYGANTEAGLVIIETRAPGAEFEADASVSGYRFSNGEGGDARINLSGPIVTGGLSAAVSGSFEKADAFVENIASSIGERGSLEQAYVQARSRWTPDELTSVDFVASLFSLDAPGLYEQEFLPVDDAVYNRNYAQTFNADRLSRPWTLINDAPKRTDEDEYVIGVSAERAFQSATLDVNASWRRLDQDAKGIDLDLTALPASAGGVVEEDRAFNFEARVSSPDGAGLDWVAGVNHYRERELQILSTLVGPGGLDDFSPAPPQRSKDRDYAVFGQVGLPLGDRVRLSLGLRYEYSEREIQQQAGFLDLGDTGSFVFEAADLDNDFDIWLPRVSLDWKLSDLGMIYAAVARGWVPGGFNLEATSEEVDQDFSRFDAERLWSYEIGAKTRVLNRRLLIQGSVFYIDADNWQEFNVLTNDQGQAISTNLITSTAAVSSYGGEMELTGRLSDTLELSSGVGWVKSEYDRFVFSQQEDFSGNRVKLVPFYDASLNLTWRPVSGLFLRGEALATGRTPLNAENSIFQKSAIRLGAQIGWDWQNWSARLFANNLTNELVFESLAFNNFIFGFDGTGYAAPAEPRVVGIELSGQW